jgi:hypothetical protein
MNIEDNQAHILSFEDIGILIDKYSRLIKNNYANILSKEFDGEAWKTEGIKIMSYIKIFGILISELEKNILNFEKEGNLDMLNEAKEELEKANIKIMPIIEETKKMIYYFEAKFKKIGKFKNTYDEILNILKKEVEKEKEYDDLYHNLNRKYLNIEKQLRKVSNEIDKDYYIGKYEKREALIDNNIKDNEFIEIKIRDEEKIEEKNKEEENKEEEIKEVFDEKFSLEKVKKWIIKNWFIFIFFLFFFMLGLLVGKI